jgi:HEAT repeat protein
MDDNENALQELTLLFQDLKTERSRRIPNSYRPLHEIRHEITDLVMSSRDAKISEFLVRKLEDPNYHVKSAAIEALSKSRDRNAVAPLLAILKDHPEDIEIRSEAAQALGQIGDTSVVPTLIQFMRHKSNHRSIIWSCADALGFIGDARAIDPLIDALVDDYSGIKDSSDIRDAAKDALIAIGGEYTVRQLLEKLSQTKLNRINYVHDAIKQDIIDVLGKLKNPVCIEALLPILRDPNQPEYTHLATIDALANYEDSRIASTLQEALNSRHHDVRISAKQVLAKLGIDEE